MVVQLTDVAGWSRYHGPIPRHTDSVITQFARAGLWGEKTIFDRFRDSASAVPAKAAIVTESGTVTYAELTDRVERLAAGLCATGTRPGQTVVAQLPNSLEFVELSLACSLVGAYFCPVNTRLRTELAHILQLTEAAALVIPAEFRGFDHVSAALAIRDEIGAPRNIVVLGNTDAGGVLNYDALLTSDIERGPTGPVDPNGPWLIEFTSGTTAAPKGVIRTHNNSLATVDAITGVFGIATPFSDDVALAAQPISFLFPYYLSVLMPLLNGLTSVIQETSDPATMLRLMDEHSVTVCSLVPSMIEPLLEARAERGFGAETLRVVQVGGAVASPSRKARLMDELDCVVLDVYGLTECSWPVGHSLASPRQEMLETTGAICRTAELKVIDGDGHAVPDGTQGEIALRGPTLFPGYFANEKATRAAIDADGWFRSGDLGILTPHRYVKISGREKDVISHGGITIAPEEIEEWLFRFPKVRAAAAFGVPDAAKGEVIWACVEPVDSDDPPTEEEVRRYLKSKIASFKVPTKVIVVPSLPTSSVGKVQRAELKRKMAGPHL